MLRNFPIFVAHIPSKIKIDIHTAPLFKTVSYIVHMH